MTNRSKLIAGGVAVLALLVILVWIFAGSVKDEGDEEERVTSAPPKISHTNSGQPIVELTRDEQSRIGLETETLSAVTQAEEFTAYGVVLDPAPLASLNAAIVSARAGLKPQKRNTNERGYFIRNSKMFLARTSRLRGRSSRPTRRNSIC